MERRDIPQIDLVVTDLDNTLYDWVTFFATAFYRMVEVAAPRLGVPESQLLDELQEVHRKHHNSEHPFALLETATVQRTFPGLSRAHVARELDGVFHEFNRARVATLKLYNGVATTLHALKEAGVPIAGHTEATVPNALFRLRKLGIEEFFRHLYAGAGSEAGHFDEPRGKALLKTHVRVKFLQRDERKPDPRVLIDICNDFAVEPDRTLYIGDSLARDVGMAKAAGTWAAWAKYGTNYDEALWKRLVRITHWTSDDVRRAEEAQKQLGGSLPDAVLEDSMEEVFSHFRFGRSQRQKLLSASLPR
jgi:FMN phosphatase YigB (HAD superfamily)